jgi:DedD protein
MDRRVKERLIGASILVVLIVLVVPELLSGPKSAPPSQPMLPAAAASETNRTVNVDLSTSKSAAASEQEEQPAPQPAAPVAPRTESASAAAAAVSAAPNSTPMPTSPAPIPQQHAAAVESVPVSPISSLHGAWSVQLGSFTSRANAENLTRQVKGQGFSAFVTEGRSGASVRYRVRVGPLPDRESAERMVAKLKSLKHDSSLVGPAG